MTEKTLFKFEERKSKKQIAEHLDQISSKLKSGEPITFESDKSIELNPTENTEFEIKVEEESEGDISLEIELEWNKNNEKNNSELNIT